MNKDIADSSFCIYGAGIVAASVYTAIKALYHKTPLFFLISDAETGTETSGETERQQPELDGIAVKRLSEWRKQVQSREDVFVMPMPEDVGKSSGTLTSIPDIYLIAAPEVHHRDIMATLLAVDFPVIEKSQMIFITTELENELMEAYYRVCMERETVSGLLSTRKEQVSESALQQIQVFQVKSHMDKPLRKPRQSSGPSAPRCDAVSEYMPPCGSTLCRVTPILPCYVTPMQAGAALTARSVADVKDNTGDHISAKNRNYCELTVTYHAWKNCKASYKGVCHYRRMFDIDDAQMQALLTAQEEWDVILPYPSVYYPDISKEHTRYVSESDWSAMLQALSETAPAYLEAYEEAVRMKEQFFLNFNMLIAKAEVFDDYCSFLFRVLERTEEIATPKGWERADRFAGYLGENLTTLYFLRNRDKLKIAYAGKIWLT